MNMIIIITFLIIYTKRKPPMSNAIYPTQTTGSTTHRTSLLLQYSCIDSEQLLGQRDVVTINHQGQLYYLRQTKAGKLILTK
jgi:hemin uptake protein HemP